MGATYHATTVIHEIRAHTAIVLAFMSLCLIGTFGYLVSAFRTAKVHRAYPAPFFLVALFAIHDGDFVRHWHTWWSTYHYWWFELWSIALIITCLIELALCYQVFKYGREELMPRLSDREFGVALIGALIALGAVWVVLKKTLDDPLFMISFPITAFMPVAGSSLLLAGRKSMRGQTMLMNYCLVLVPTGMFGAWLFLDPFFRRPAYIVFSIASIAWALANVYIMRRYPAYEPPAPATADAATEPSSTASTLQPA